MSLSKKHNAFVDEYLRLWNGTQAYLRVYKHCSRKSAPANASRLLSSDNIIEAIKQRLADAHMQTDEVLKLLADMARGDMGEFLDVSGMGFNLDLQDAKARGLTKLIRKVKQKTTTYLAKKESEEDREVHELEIELYDAQAALEKIGRHLDLFPNKVDLTSAGEKIKGIIQIVEHNDDVDPAPIPPPNKD